MFSRDKESCVRCEKKLGFRKHKPELTWKFNGNLCGDCFSFAEKSTQYYDAKYIDGDVGLPKETKGNILLTLFDNKNDFIFVNKKNEILLDVPIASLSKCDIESKTEKSLKRELLTAGLSKNKENRYLRIEYPRDNRVQYLLFDLGDKLELANTPIKKFMSRQLDKLDSMLPATVGNQDRETISKAAEYSDFIRAVKSEVTKKDYEGHEIEPSVGDEDDEDDDETQIAELKRYCNSCDTINNIDSLFCSHCGHKLVQYETETRPVKVIEVQEAIQKEKIFFKEKGQLIVKRVEHRGGGRKVASWLVGGPIGYILIGRDKTKQHKIKGTLILTDKAIYCSGNVYPYDEITAISKERKSVILILNKLMEGNRFDVTLYLKTGNLHKLFTALENARTGHLM